MSRSLLYRPRLYDLSLDSDYQHFTTLLENNTRLECYDTLSEQIKELVRSRNPSVANHSAVLEDLILDHYLSINYDRYGVWVYYSWTESAVRVLPENEFIEVRTSRNQMKITKDEQAYLNTKKIGIVGLSVGQSVAFTLALERCAGELRLADYDTLDLSNLNRLRGKISQLGTNKSVILAREIAELDPFLKIRIYKEGITDENVDEFLAADGGIDLLHEECDDVYVKIMIREKSRSLGIPVIMEASDKCTVDIERFDLDRHRPLLHGMIPNVKSEDLKDLTDPGKAMGLILDMVDVDNLSARVKASIVEIGHTIPTWPQLASAVNLGGGVSADLSRQVLLNNFSHSGRYQVDIDEIFEIPNPGSSFDRELPDPLEIKEIISQYHKLNPESESYLKPEELPFGKWIEETFNVFDSDGHIFLFGRDKDISRQQQMEVQVVMGFISALTSSQEQVVCQSFPVPGSRQLIGVLKSRDGSRTNESRPEKFRSLLTEWSHTARPLTLPEDLQVEGMRRNLLTPYGSMQLSPVLNPYLSFSTNAALALRLVRQRGVSKYLNDWDSGSGLDSLITGLLGSGRFIQDRIPNDSASLIAFGKAVGQIYNEEEELIISAIYFNSDESDNSDSEEAIIQIAFDRVDKDFGENKRSGILSKVTA